MKYRHLFVFRSSSLPQDFLIPVVQTSKKVLGIGLFVFLLNQVYAHNKPAGSAIDSAPLLFMENKGQIRDQEGNTRPEVLYTLRSKGVTMLVLRNGISYQFSKSDTDLPNFRDMDAAKQTDTECTDLYRMDVTLVGAGTTPRVVVSGASDYTENYFNVPDYPDGITGIRGYEKVTLEGVYPGIDWVLYTENGEVKYDFIVHAGADPSLIRLEYSGAVALKILPEDGTLMAVTPMGEIREAAPVCFSGDSRVEAGFNLNSNILSFDLGAYDTTRDLVIDPALLWSTYFGGTDYDYAYATTTDFFGNVYLSGFAKSSGLATSGAHQTILSGTLGDAFLAKYNSSGVRQWATYYGGTNLEIAYSVAVNDAGDVYLTGFTNSTANIASTGAYDVTYGGAGLRDAFLVKFNSSGTRQWGTYYGGAGNDEGYSLGIASDGSVFFAGTTGSTSNISTLNSYRGGSSDAFLVNFSSSGARIWSCYYGGSGADEFIAIAVDRVNNDVYLPGATNSNTGIANGGSPFQSTLSGGTDAFLAKFDANGTNLWGTYYGGTGEDCGFSIAIDKSGAIYMAGRTASNTGISTTNARAGLEDGFITKFTSNGARTWGRYFGGPAKDEGYFVAVDGTNGVYVSGYTESSTGINSSGITNFSSYSGTGDVMAAKFDISGTPVWSTYFGGTGADYGYGIAVDGKGDVYLAGQLASSVSMSGGDDLTYGGGGGDAFLAKIDESSCPIFTGAPANVTVTNSMCPSFTGGEITPPSASPSPCPYGSTIQYAVSTDGGTSYGSWSTTIPVYDQDGPSQTVKTRCNCDSDGSVSSSESTPVSTQVAHNPTNGGIIDNAQCGAENFNPLAITSLVAPSGETGMLEYKWQHSTTSESSGFSDIANSNSETYDPGALAVTTWYRRLARVDCMADWSGAAESNTIQILVDNLAPVITCPANVTVNAASGACTAVATYSLPSYTDNCSPPSSFVYNYSFSYTGGVQNWTVPAGVTSVDIQAWGAQGGYGAGLQTPGGQGGYASGRLSVTPGDVLQVYVGGQGATANITGYSPGGYNGGGQGSCNTLNVDRCGGGGGGATDLRVGGLKKIVAAGGGGSAAASDLSVNGVGGVGGGNIGGNGQYQGPCSNGGPGYGGTQTAGGGGPVQGSIGQGGNANTPFLIANGSGGGGGGYFGGGAGSAGANFDNLGYCLAGAGGGGGSSYIGGVSNGSTTSGGRTGNGYLTLSYLVNNSVLVSGQPSGSSFPAGSNKVVYFVTDNAGNLSTCSFTVKVNDTTAPSFTDPADVTLYTDTDGVVCPANNSVSPAASQSVPVATGGTAFNYTVNGVTRSGPTGYSDLCYSGSNLKLYLWAVNLNKTGTTSTCSRQIELTWRVYDADGNYAEQKQIITIVDRTAPTFTRPADGTFTAPGCTYVQQLPAVTGDVTNESDNCQTGLNATFSDGAPTAGACPGTFIVNRTWSLVDGCGNTAANQVQVITINENTAPAVSSTNSPNDPDIDNYTCGATFTINAGPSTCFINLTVAKPVWVDACGGSVTRAQSASNGVPLSNFGDFVSANFPVGTTIVTFSATDCQNNTGSCTLSITINDTQLPTITGCPTNQTATADPGQCTRSLNLVIPTAGDNCSVTSVTYATSGATTLSGTEFPNPLTFNLGVTTVVYRTFDAAGNSRSCTFTVTITDPVPPVAVCKNAIAQLSASGTASITGSMLDNGSTDNCLVTFTPVPASFTCTNLGANTVTLNVSDGTNTRTCTAVVTVQDVTPPTASCMNYTLQLNSSGSGTLAAANIDNTSTDACGIITRTLSKTAFTCADLGPNTVTLTLSDASGNTSTCTGTVTVQDITSPVALCQNVTVALVGNSVTVTAAQVNNNSIDACGITSMSLSPSTFNCSNVGLSNNLVTLSVYDASGNRGQCIAIVNVQPGYSPTARCDSITVQLDPNGEASVSLSDIDDGSLGGCTLNVTLNVPDWFTAGSNCASAVCVSDTMQFRSAVNGSDGNYSSNCPIGSSFESWAYFQVVTPGTIDMIIEGAPPPGPVGYDAAVWGPFSSPDCSQLDLTTEQYCELDVSGGRRIMFTAATGYYMLMVTNPDNVAGFISLHDNKGTAVIQTCSSNNTTSNHIYRCADVGDNTVRLLVTDASGNTATCNALVKVEDNIDPVILTCPPARNLPSCGSLLPEMTYEVSAGDNCGYTVSQYPLPYVNVGDFDGDTIIVTFTVTDASANTARCTSVVTIDDTTPPIALCVDMMTLNLGGTGMAMLSASQINAGSLDDCTQPQNLNFTLTNNMYTCSDIGTTNEALNIQDGGGNLASCIFTVTIRDTIAPMITSCPPNRTVNCTTTFIPDMAGSLTAIDNCTSSSNIVKTQSPAAGSALMPTGPVTVTFTASDNSGNTHTCTALLTLSDSTPPSFAWCPPNTTVNNDAGTCGLVYTFTIPLATDNCSVPVVTQISGPASSSTLPTGATSFTFRASDTAGNTATCSWVVTVRDVTPPTAVCQNITVPFNGSGTAIIAGSQLDNGSTDNCINQGALTFSASVTSFTCANIGANTVTLTVTDVNSNTATCTSVVTIQDITPPAAVCRNVTATLDGSGNVTFTAAQMNNGSTDNCGGTLTFLPASVAYTCADVGAQTVSLSVTDANGNTSTCTSTITVLDVTPPTAVCQNITVSLNGSGTAIIAGSQLNNGSTDNCISQGTLTFSASVTSFTCANIGANTVTLTVTDVNSNTATCTSVVTIQDITPPVAICRNITATLNGSGNATVTAAQMNNGSTDNCGGTLTFLPASVAYTCADVGAQTVSLSVTDANGNTSSCTSVITIQDVTPPTAMCASPTVFLDNNGTVMVPYTQISNMSGDNCGGGLTYSPLSVTYDCSHVGTNSYSLTVSDASGNVATCTATVTVKDTTPPAATCHNITATLDGSGNATVTAAQMNNSSTDNCGGTLTFLPASVAYTCANVGAQTVSLSVTDASGNTATCTSTITVQDVTPPTAMCAHPTVFLDNNGTAMVSYTQISNMSGDNCGGGLSYSPLSVMYDCTQVGSNSYTLTVSDASGNMATCTATVTVKDATPPTATCRNITASLDGSGNATVTAAQLNNGSTDNCNTPLTFSPASLSLTCTDAGAQTVALTVTDASGNTATCTSVITVTDGIAPVFADPADVELTTSTGAACPSIADVSLTASESVPVAAGNTAFTYSIHGKTLNGPVVYSDNCSAGSDLKLYCWAINSDFGGNAGTCPRQVQITWRVYDKNDANYTEQTQLITVADDIAPVFTRPADITINSDAGCSPNSLVSVTGDVTDENDNCSQDLQATFSDGPPVTVSCGVFYFNRTWSLQDACGNAAASQVQRITVRDGTAPVIASTNSPYDPDIDDYQCGDAFTYETGPATCFTLRTIARPSWADACGGTVTRTHGANNNVLLSSFGDFVAGNFPSGTTVVTFSATDCAGNPASCSLTITVNDWQYPVLAGCQTDRVLSADPGLCSRQFFPTTPEASDNCAITSVLYSMSGATSSQGTGFPNALTCNVGLTTVTYRVSDEAGNVRSCSFNVTVVDQSPPTALCRDASVSLNSQQEAVITAVSVDNGSYDNCQYVVLSVTPSVFSCASLGTNQVTLQVSDGTYSSTCTAVVTVQDNLPPSALCRNTTVQLDNTGQASLSTAAVNNNSSDGCSIANYSLSKSLFTCADQGISTVTLSVSDAAGNSGTCTALITVQDNLPPSMRCKDVAVTLGSSGTAVVTASQLDDGSSDNCSSQLVFTAASFSFNTSNVGNHVVTLMATDERGNTATCTPVITVNGIVGPTASCRDVTVSLDASGTATVTSAQLDNGSYNNQSGPITLSPASVTYTCADAGVTVVTLTVTDNLGNSATCTSQVTVQDVTPPVASCLNTTATLSTSGTATVSSAELGVNSSDNCGGPLVFTPVNAVFTCVSVGTNTVSLTVTDTHGNTSTCTSLVTIQDAIAPVAYCRDVILSLDASGMAILSGTQLDNGSLDNCSAQLILSPVSTTYNCADAGVRTVTLMVTDMSGNTATCNSTVTVRDASAPVALCRDVTASLNASGLVTVGSAQLDNGSYDNCGSPLTLTPATITWYCANAGEHVVTLTVSDVHGNTASCASTVTVQDETPPVAYCRNATKALNASGTVTISSGDLDAGSYDNCNGQLVFSPATVNYSCANLGTNQVTLTVTDANGNNSSCLSLVSIIDITAPVALCRDVTASLDASGVAVVSSSQLDNGSNDNCNGPLVFSPAALTFSCADAGTRTITLFVADAYGNVAACTSLVTVQDVAAPVALCRDVTVSLNSAGTVAVTAFQLDNGSSDNCTVLNFTPSSVSYTCADAGMQQVTLTVTDNSGHTASCTSTITVEDSANPIALCNNLTVSLDESGTATVAASQINNGSFDGCTPQSSLILTPSAVVYNCDSIGLRTITLVVTDENSDTGSCQSVITVQDLTAPVALCRDITLSLNALGTATVSGVQLDNGSSDNCTVSLNYSPAELNYYCENVGIHPVTLTTRDASGNAGTCVSMVTVRDTITPVAVCKDVSVSTGPSGLANVSGIQADNGSSDNCGYPLTFTPEIISYTCADTGVHVVTITVTDKHGNTATCTSAITVRDLLAPVAECRNAYKSLELSGSVTVYGAELIQSTSYDNCGGPLRLSPDSIVYSCSSTGLHVVTLTVTDQSGNSSACTSSVVISDITRPTALCRDTTLYLDIQGTAYLNSAQLDNGSHDNCPGQVTFSQINLGYSCAQAGTYETYLTVTDVSGNTATCSSMVTIRDTIKPNFTRPVDITLHADDLCNVNLTPYGAGDVNTESDNCAWGIQATYTDGPPTGTGCPGEYTFVRTWSLQDASGNAAPDQQQQITVIDRTPPVVSTTDSPLNPDIEQFYCGQTWWYQASDQACHISRTLAEPVWTDACDSQISTDAFTDNNTVLTDQNGYYEADFPVGTTVVTFRATDCPGNTATCSIRIIVSDNQQPVITGCPGNITTATAPGSCQRGLTLPVPVTTDNCGIAGVSWTADGVTISSGTTFPTYMNFNRGVTTLTYSVSDLSGNTTACVYQITILDQEPPLAVCRNAVVMLNANGWGVLSEPVVNNGSDDACGIASYQLSQSVFDCGDLGARTVLLTVTDVAGNTATCSSQVTVELLEPITASLPSSQPVLCLGNAIPLVTHTTSGATGIGTPVGLPAGVTAEWINHIITISGTPANPGVYTYHIPLTGACEVVSASGVITVNTMPAQTVSIAENSGSTPNDGFLCAGAGATLAVAGGVSLQWSNGGTGMSVAVMPTVTTLYQVTATDASGCTTTASATINVQNQPVLTGLSPTSGSAGTQVVITGSRLSDVTGITFNGVSATGFILISDTEIRANLPVSGQVQTLGAGSPCGPATLEIRQPVITGFQPSSGPPGTLITISGTDFQNLNGVSVNGTAAIVISSSATNIRAYLMPGTQSGAITVTTATGTGISSGTFTVTPTPHPSIQQGSKLSVTGQTGTPQSGSVVAVSADGNTAVIGGPQDNSGTGAVWVFVRNGTTWSQQGTKLVGTGATGAARQGTSVAISADGNTIASGGPGDNTNAGAVWIFKRNGTTWSQQGSKLTGSGATGAALQGTAVSLSANGNTLASGGQADDAYAGAVWVFSQSGGTWTQQGSKLIGAGATGKARQGAALALSADATTLLVGGYNDNSRAGAVWIYTSASGTWSQQGDKLVGSGGLQALQGSSVAISANGNTILTGGPGDNSLAGSLWVFVRSSGIWSQQGTKLAGTSGAGSSRQGSATGLSADGNTAIWGGYGDNTNVGAYWAFKRSGATWTQQGGKITGTGAVGAARQSTGLSVSANGSTAISGGPTDASGKGAAWVFIAGAQAYTQELDTRVTAVTEEMPEFVLYQNAPNPHTGRTSVGFRLPAPCRAVWQITDASGRMVMEMTRDYPAGYNEETFELSGLSGVFEYSLTTPWGVKARKMVVVR